MVENRIVEGKGVEENVFEEIQVWVLPWHVRTSEERIQKNYENSNLENRMKEEKQTKEESEEIRC